MSTCLSPAFDGLGEEGFHFVADGGVVVLEGQEPVAASGADIRGDARLAADGVDGHQRPVQVQPSQHPRDGLDFVFLVQHLFAAEHQARPRRPGVDDVGDGPARVPGAAEGFPVDGDLPGRPPAERGRRPQAEDVEDVAGGHQSEDAPERVVAGHPVGQRNVLAQPGEVDEAELLHVVRGVVPAEQGADGREEKVAQDVLLGAVDARAGHEAQTRGQRFRPGPGGTEILKFRTCNHVYDHRY